MTIRPIIGFEIHVQLATQTKLYCACPVEFAGEPNSRVCPVCMGMPGSLPVLNRRAYEFAMTAGLALNCRVAEFTKWDRKSYFYPDLPKNYQISQYDFPASADGFFELPINDGVTRKIGIIRAHLEEDAGKNLHEGLDHTRVDLNRAGTPLLEIVTKPDIADADEAYTFCVELQRLVRHLGISEADMQKGQMRFEPNVNVHITDDDGRIYKTPISEVKNLNSFRSVRSAIKYEIDRQVREWQSNHDYTLEKVGKLNFGWDDAREVTEFQRGKEESHDYRYFPDPDLTPVRPDAAWIESLRAAAGELPVARTQRFMAKFGMTAKDCEVILADRTTGDLFDAAIAGGADSVILTKQFMGIWNHLASARDKSISELGVSVEQFAELVTLVAEGAIGASAAMTIAEKLLAEPSSSSPRQIAESAGLLQIRDEAAMQCWLDQAFAANPQAIADAAGTNEKKAKAAVGFLRGQLMKISQGKADPKLAGEMIEQEVAKLRT